MAALALLAGCRTFQPQSPHIETWSRDSKVLIVHEARAPHSERVSAESEAQALDWTYRALLKLGVAQIMPLGSAVADAPPISSEYSACVVGRESGADLVVMLHSEDSVVRYTQCAVKGAGFTPLEIPVPWIGALVDDGNPHELDGSETSEFDETAGENTSDGVVSESDGCLVKVDHGYRWRKVIMMEVLDTQTCQRTGAAGEFPLAGQGPDKPLPGLLLDHKEWLEQHVTELFPAQLEVARVDERGRAVVRADPRTKVGEVYSVSRLGENALAYVRSVQRNTAVIEPYQRDLQLESGDLLQKRGVLSWAELTPHYSLSRVELDGEKSWLHGPGGALQIAIEHWMLTLEFDWQPLATQPKMTGERLTSIAHFGGTIGPVYHLAPSVDAYLLVGGGGSVHLLAGGDEARTDTGPYATVRGGLKLSLGPVYLNAEAGGMYSGVFASETSTHVERGPQFRVGLGLER